MPSWIRIAKSERAFQRLYFVRGNLTHISIEIYKKILEHDDRVFGTRASQDQYEKVREAIPDIQYNPVSKILKVNHRNYQEEGKGLDCCLFWWYGGHSCGGRGGGDS